MKYKEAGSEENSKTKENESVYFSQAYMTPDLSL